MAGRYRLLCCRAPGEEGRNDEDSAPVNEHGDEEHREEEHDTDNDAEPREPARQEEASAQCRG